MANLIRFDTRLDEDGDLLIDDATLAEMSVEERNYLLDNNNRLFTLRDLTVEEEAELARLIAATQDKIEAGLL